MRTLKTLIYTDRNNLRDLLRRLRTRRHLLLTLRGVAIALSAGAAILLLTGWAAHRYRYSFSALLTLRIGALLMVLTTSICCRWLARDQLRFCPCAILTSDQFCQSQVRTVLL